MAYVTREMHIERMIAAVQAEAERDPATALRGRLVCRGFRSGMEVPLRASVQELEALLRKEIFGTTPVPLPEEHDHD